jgi:pimeloyl-ACP methyl ester carboxylesterase
MTHAEDLNFTESGSGDAVLLIHGTGAAQWGDLPPLLAPTQRVISYDRRSFGASGGPTPDELSDHALDAAALIERLDATPAAVVGWSMGGVIALELAAIRPELVSGLVLIEPPLHAKRRPTLSLAVMIAKVQVLRRVRGDRSAATTFLRWAGWRRDGTTELDRLPAPLREQLLANAGAIVREIDLGTGEHLSTADTEGIRCPVTCLLGAESQPAFARSAARLAELVPSTRVEGPIAGAGHWLQFDAPQQVAAAVAALRPRP